MKNGDMPAMPVMNGDNEPAEFDRPFYRNSNLAVGLTKRKEFAKAAMQGLLAGVSDLEETYAEAIARDAVSYADALLDELDRTKSS